MPGIHIFAPPAGTPTGKSKGLVKLPIAEKENGICYCVSWRVVIPSFYVRIHKTSPVLRMTVQEGVRKQGWLLTKWKNIRKLMEGVII